MFETELILWLQSFSVEWLTRLMAVLTPIGDARTFIALALIVTFGYDFQKGFILFQVVMWNGALTGFLKNTFALPRPLGVDATVELLGTDTANVTPFVAADGDTFFDLPEQEAIQHYRAAPAYVPYCFGFPSHHVSMATSFGLASAALVRSSRVAVLALTYVLIVAFSRLYLGRHFLADVLGGFVVGALVLVGVRAVFKTHAARLLLKLRSMPVTWPSWQKALAALLFSVPPLLLLGLGANSDFLSVGRLLAANIAFSVLFLRGMPAERPTIGSRIARVTLALVLFVGTTVFMKLLTTQLGLAGTDWGAFWRGFVPPFVYLLGTVELGTALGFYWKQNRRSRRHLQFATNHTLHHRLEGTGEPA